MNQRNVEKNFRVKNTFASTRIRVGRVSFRVVVKFVRKNKIKNKIQCKRKRNEKKAARNNRIGSLSWHIALGMFGTFPLNK